ncbi:unnamed protein product [Adineta ricciae]|uniref:PDZ domain-containing protein n=1 Tax=Adineta ricciae TaxID=249248 RepID=A0A813RF79_ADIRI|nr:unnamed protein product [Adineta ricciae]
MHQILIQLDSLRSRQRDILVFLNEKNLLKLPITITYDQIKTEFTSLRRQNKSIRIGLCRCTDRSLLNNTTVRHLGSLTFNEFRKLSIDDRRSTSSFNESRKSLIIIDDILSNSDSKQSIVNRTKHIQERHSKPLVYKRSTSPARDSGFVETDGRIRFVRGELYDKCLGTNTSVLTDRSALSNHHKHRSKLSLEKSEDESMDTHKSLDSLQQSITKTTSLEEKKVKSTGTGYTTEIVNRHRPAKRQQPTQTVTDACFIYRRQAVKVDANDDDKAAMILRGREIAYEAANTPAIPSSMPMYSRDQIRELYGELDKKTRRLQEDEYTIHSWNEKPQWKLASPTKAKKIEECPLPKFRLEKSSDDDEALLMAAYLSSGMNSPQTKAAAPVDNLYQAMINASAKVNEWAHNNEIYLSPTEKDLQPVLDSSALLLDTQLNLKQLAITPTNSHPRPTVLTTTEQVQFHPSSNTFSSRNSRRSIRRQVHLVDTISSSPDSIQIAFETSPSTPGSCGMYLEPYMRHGYSLPSTDHYIRDSSWQHTDNDDLEESASTMQNITPTDSPTITAKVDMDMFPSPPGTSQIIETDSLIDLDDGTTVSYHTAKESRVDNGHQSSLSLGSDDTTGSNFQQYHVRDDLVNSVTTPEDSFYYDALPSPSHTNRQVSTASENSNVMIENLTDLLEQIETYSRTNHQIVNELDEHQARVISDDEESLLNIDQLVTIVEDINRCNQAGISNTMDNHAFIYDNLDEQTTKPPIDNLVEIVQSIDEAPSRVNNLLIIYDETLTPTEDEPRQVINDSDEWSYDNLIGDSDEHANTDNLDTTVHESLTAKYQKPIEFNEIQETIVNIDNLVQVVSEALSVTDIDDDISEPTIETDNLGTIIHEALAARFQKPIKMKTPRPFDFEVFTEELPNSFDQFAVDRDRLDAIVAEALEGPYQKPNTMIPTDPFETEVYSAQLSESSDNDSIVNTDNLGTIIHESLAARSQQPIRIKTADQDIPKTQPEEVPTDDNHIESSVNQSPPSEAQPTDFINFEVVPKAESETINEMISDSDNVETVIHEASPTLMEKSDETESPIELFNSETIPNEIPQSVENEPICKTPSEDIPEQDESNIEYKKSIENPPPEPYHFDYPMEEETNDDTIEYEILKESPPPAIEKQIDQVPDDTHTSETLVYEIESSMPLHQFPVNQPTPHPPPPTVNNLSQIVSDSLLTSSNYHQFRPNENQIEFHVLHAPTYDEEIYEEYGYRRTTTEPGTDDIVEKFEELCHHYTTNFQQYRTTAKQFDDDINQFEKQLYEQREQNLSPVSDTMSEELITTIERVIDNGNQKGSKADDVEEVYSTVLVTRQADHVGKYGFDFEEVDDGKIKISSILDGNYCPNLSIGDEIIAIDDSKPHQTYEEYKSSFDSLWINARNNVQITVTKADIPVQPNSEPASLQSSSLSWPLSIAESGRLMKYGFALACMRTLFKLY